MKEFKKFNEDEWYKKWVDDDIFEYLVDEVKYHLIGNSSDYQTSILQNLWICESPIEQLLYLDIIKSLGDNEIANPYVNIGNVLLQENIYCGDKKYRVDFLIPVEYTNPKDKSIIRKFYVIECDGHEFHEKTKKQVIKNNERTRDLQEYGYDVIKFSGSEIYHTSNQCAISIFKIIYNYFWINIMNIER